MATEAQVVANRLNAQKSTGPCTAEGKAVVAQNAVKHGLRTERAVIVGEDPGEFEFYRDEMLGELSPAGAMESMLAERVVCLSWRLRRAERVQNEAFDALLAKDAANPLARLTKSLRPRSDSGAGAEESALGRVAVHDFGNARVLDRLLMYERRIEHSLYKTMTGFQRLRLMRELEPVMEEPTRQSERWGKPQPDMERPSSRVIIRLFSFWTTYFFVPRQRMCGRFPVVGEGPGCDRGSIPAGAALHRRSGTRPGRSAGRCFSSHFSGVFGQRHSFPLAFVSQGQGGGVAFERERVQPRAQGSSGA